MGRVGVYPGSFNPPTVAHLAIADAARRVHDLDRLVLSVSRSALAKEHVEHPPFDDRIDVLAASIAHLPWLEVRVTDRRLLADIADGYDLLVLGADKWRQIHDPAWYGGDPAARDAALARLPVVVVVPRDGIDVPGHLLLHVPEADGVSSTRARSGDHHLMTPAARAYAERTGAWRADVRATRGLDTTSAAVDDGATAATGVAAGEGIDVAVARETMTDEQRKSVALEYLKAFDNGGVTSAGDSILSLFASDAQVWFPKWGLATGHEQIGQMFGDVGGTIQEIVHHYSHFNWIMSGGDMFACEGTSHGVHRDGPWRAGVDEWKAGRWCDVFEVRDFLIQRCFIYLDPDYASQDTARYPWLASD